MRNRVFSSKRARMVARLSLVLSLVLINACSTEQPEQQPTQASNAIDLSQDTNGELVSIQSDNVSMAGYDASTQMMTVVFDSGDAYWYQPVDQSTWTAFYLAQPHPWSQIGYPQLVQAGIPYGKLNK
jgi:hypothetical protein